MTPEEFIKKRHPEWNEEMIEGIGWATKGVVELMQEYAKQYQPLKTRSQKIELLEAYSLFLEKDGYMDIDWRAEEPYAIDEFLKPKEQ